MLSLAWIAYWAVLAMLGVYGAHRLYLTTRYWCSRRPDPEPPGPEPRAAERTLARPLVTVQLPLYNEKYVAERLIDAVAALDWPRDRLEIQILDDSTDDTRELCRRKAETLASAGYAVHHLHRVDRAGYKAGALQAGLEVARGELILILDADFVPRPNLLHDTVGYFADPMVAMAQVRWEHLNRTASVLTWVQALLLDGHFVVEQTTRHRTGRTFNFNGTAGVWRRDAIDAAGGWHCDTLTEDLDLSYRAALAGYRFVYRVEAAAPAELPEEMNAFKSQQYRWAKGSVQVARKLLPAVLGAKLPLSVKVEAFFHLTQNVPYLFTLGLVLLSVPALLLRPSTLVETAALHLPALGLTGLALGSYVATSQRELGRSPWRALAGLPALVAITIGICVNQSRAVLEGALGHRSEFVRTPKRGRLDLGAGYRGLRDLTPTAEIALALYFAAFAALAAASARWLVLPLFGFFAAGFAYVGIRSALRM